MRAQELQLPSGGVVRRRHTVDERLEIRRIAFVAGLELGRRDLALDRPQSLNLSIAVRISRSDRRSSTSR